MQALIAKRIEHLNKQYSVPEEVANILVITTIALKDEEFETGMYHYFKQKEQTQ